MIKVSSKSNKTQTQNSQTLGKGGEISSAFN